MSDNGAHDRTAARGDEHHDEDVVRDDYDDDVERNPAERGKWISALVALLGLWLVIEAYLFNPIAGNFWSDVIVGLALVVLGGYNYYRRSSEHLGSVGVGAFVALLGLWLIITPFVLGSTEGAAAVEFDIELWNDILVGLLVFLLGAYSAYKARERAPVAPAART